MNYDSLTDRIESSSKFTDFVNKDINYPEDAKRFFRPKQIPDKGDYIIDILPWRIGTKNHPSVVMGEKKVGDADYVLIYGRHWHEGLNNNSPILCLRVTYGLPCPECEAINHLDKKSPEYEARKARTRAVYNVLDHQDNKILKIFDISHFQFEKELTYNSKANSTDGIAFNFVHPEHGASVKFHFIGSLENMNPFKNFSWVQREAISRRVLSKVYSLDEFLYKPTYEEVEQAMRGMTNYTESEDVEIDDVSEESKPRGKQVKKEDKITCPFENLTFGEDFESDDKKCNECSNAEYDACQIENEKFK